MDTFNFNIIFVFFFLFLVAIVALLAFVVKTIFSYKKSRKNEEKQKNNDVVLPIRLRAYERLTLLLNRIEPKNLFLEQEERLNSALELKNTLIQKINNEYNHNVSQQIYVSEILWEELMDVKHNLIELITSVYSKCDENDAPEVLQRVILEAYYSQEQTFIDAVILSLKSEVKDLF